jgi:hypothetical protein
MVLNNEPENFSGNEMQTYSTINLHKFIEKKLSRPFLRIVISIVLSFPLVLSGRLIATLIVLLAFFFEIPER